MERSNVMPGTGGTENEEILLMKKQLKIQKLIAVFVLILCVLMAGTGTFLAVRLSGSLQVLDQTLQNLDEAVESLNLEEVNEAVDNLNRTISPIVNLMEAFQ